MTLKSGKKRPTRLGLVKDDDRIICDIWKFSEESKRKEEYNVLLVNSTTSRFRNQGKSAVCINQSSILIETVDDSPFANSWSVNDSSKRKIDSRR